MRALPPAGAVPREGNILAGNRARVRAGEKVQGTVEARDTGTAPDTVAGQDTGRATDMALARDIVPASDRLLAPGEGLAGRPPADFRSARPEAMSPDKERSKISGRRIGGIVFGPHHQPYRESEQAQYADQGHPAHCVRTAALGINIGVYRQGQPVNAENGRQGQCDLHYRVQFHHGPLMSWRPSAREMMVHWLIRVFAGGNVYLLPVR
jgi:hypothetical protein